MIFKLGMRLENKEGIKWFYWDKVEEVISNKGKLNKKKDEAWGAIIQGSKTPIHCTRLCISPNTKDGDLLHMYFLKIKDKTEQEVVATDYFNNSFLLTDEGKTIERL
jgi:hypothetical protein